MQVKKKMIERKVAGETVLVPIGATVLENNGLFMMTETGSFIWDILPECENEEEIVERILKEYDAPRKTVENDVKKFLESLREYEII